MLSLIQRNREYWNHERSLTALLIYMAIALFAWILLPDFAQYTWSFLISDVLFNLIILAGVFSVLTRWRKQIFFIGVALSTSVIRVVVFFTGIAWLRFTGELLDIFFFVLLARMVLGHIFKEGPVNHYRIEGSIVVYMIVGVIYALLYTFTELIFPGSFVFTEINISDTDPYSQFLYFSFVTMTTLGYGDMIPVGSLAKSLVIFQGMFGMLYPVIMIARLVSLEVTHSAQGKKQA